MSRLECVVDEEERLLGLADLLALNFGGGGVLTPSGPGSCQDCGDNR